MNHAELVALERVLRGREVLSVYLDGEVTSPAARTAWRRRLENSLAHIGTSLEHASDRRSFALAAELLRERLAPFTGALGSAGWAAFVTPDAVHFAEPLPVPVPGSVSWGFGLRVVPLLRALKLSRCAIVAVADARSTRLFRYRRGKLERLATHRGLERPDADREVAELVDRMLDLSSRDDWLLFGGPKSHAEALAEAVPPRLVRRAAVLPATSAWAGEAELAQVAERTVATLRRTYESAVVDALLEGSTAGGFTVTSPERTFWALGESVVDELVLTRRFTERQPEVAETLVRDAFDLGAMVEELGSPAADRLDLAGGVGAILRTGYRTPAAGVAVISEWRRASGASDARP